MCFECGLNDLGGHSFRPNLGSKFFIFRISSSMHFDEKSPPTFSMEAKLSFAEAILLRSFSMRSLRTACANSGRNSPFDALIITADSHPRTDRISDLNPYRLAVIAPVSSSIICCLVSALSDSHVTLP